MNIRLHEIISKWTIHTDCNDNLAKDLMAWVKESEPEIIISKRKNPIKERISK